MNIRHSNSTSILILALGLAISHTATAQKIQVDSAIPASGAQGTLSLDVEIGGNGFGDDVDEVIFLLPCPPEPEPCVEDPGGIVVKKFNVHSRRKIVAEINLESAVIADFDIAVRSTSRGRGGKGTTLFRVTKAEDQIVTLEITYEFGALTDDKCVEPECVLSTITATGAVECGQNQCSFNTRAESADFALPSGFRELMFATEWRRTPLDPDICFGSSDADPVGIAQLGTDENGIDRDIILLTRDNDGIWPWYASVGTFARDVDDLEDRQYIFNFEGCGADGDCGVFAPGSMEGTYVGGELVRIDSHGNDRQFESIPCRCTRSNTPDCPDDVPVPTPQMRITVIEVPPTS